MIIKQISITPFANVAQSVEQLIRNQQVMGSSPIISSKLRFIRSFFVFTIRTRKQKRTHMAKPITPSSSDKKRKPPCPSII